MTETVPLHAFADPSDADRYARDRHAALEPYAILDTPAEPGFDGIALLASQICDAPVALVSLIAGDRQWFKARIGFGPSETELNRAVCAHLLVESGVLIIPDLTQDVRGRDNPLVTGEPHVRFYAGAPFHAASGEVLGSLCVIDTVPRPGGLTEPQVSGLKTLALQVTALLEMRRAIIQRDALALAQHETEVRRQALLHLGDTLREMTTADGMTRAAASIVGETLQADRVRFSQLDENGVALPGVPDWITDRPDPAGIDALHAQGGLCSAVTMPVREHGRTVALLVVHNREPRVWPPEVLAFLHNAADRLVVAIARLNAEAKQLVLNHELSHRLKNTFAIIQAIATQTLRSVPDQEPVEAFVRRLHALSAAHEVLLQQRWSSAKIGDVVENVVKALADLERFDIDGPEVELGPRATLSLSLLLHELATNAIKYGSLQGDSGRVAVVWQLGDAGDGVELTLEWRESGGPPVEVPTATGFGSKLIRMGLVGTGGVELRYLLEGLDAVFKAPLDQVQLS